VISIAGGCVLLVALVGGALYLAAAHARQLDAARRALAERDLERIFELFRRSGPQDRQGEGIGLAHVRALVRRLGGDVAVQSVLGQGTTFTVTFAANLRFAKPGGKDEQRTGAGDRHDRG
jgi:C4-dicarboxylate-specific signal transduction histidine kinase